MTDDVTDGETKEHHQHEIDTTMKDNSADNDESFTALIEKVVSEQIEKLASEFDTENKINLPNEQNEIIEKSDLVHESNAMSNTEKAQLDNDKDDHVDDDRVSETTMAINSEIAVAEDEKTEEKEDEIVATTTSESGMSIIESVDLNSESESTIVPTNPPEQTTNMETILADNVHEEHKDDAELNGETLTTEDDEKVSEETSSKNEIPEALLNAVGDLLSSVLGVSVTSIKNGLFIPTADAPTTTADNIENDNIHTDTEGSATTENDIVEHSTEQDLSSSTSALEFNENNEEEEIKTEATDVMQNNESEIDTSVVTMPQESDAGTIANEIDLKIENLGNVHDTNFMTEDTPEVYTESVKEPEMPSSDDIKTEIAILEAMPALTVEEESIKPVSFEESVNHIMNLVKDTEDKMELENAQNIIDSVLIDHNIVHNNVNHILKSALKEIETNFGMNEQEIEKEIQIPTDALEMLDQEREEMIKNFETDINESLIDSSIDQEEIYEPNMAKAALFHKFQYDDDF